MTLGATAPPAPPGIPGWESAPSQPVEASGSERLRSRQRLLGGRMWAASRRLWNHPEVGRIYPALLFRSHCNARATVAVLEAAAARLETMVGDDPVAPGLLAFLRGFIPEEMGHDEWLLEDLEALGIDRREVLARTPPPAIAALVGAQYYWIAHHHPVSVLGYCFVTETAPVPVAEVEDLIHRTGLPPAAFRTILRHAAIDLKHAADMERIVDALPLTSAHLAMMGVSLAHTMNSIAQSTEELCDLHEIRSKAAPEAGAGAWRAELF
jgi:hypothetical protein